MAAPKRIGFYCELPPQCISEIRRRAKASSVPQWQIIALSIVPTKASGKRTSAKK